MRATMLLPRKRSLKFQSRHATIACCVYLLLFISVVLAGSPVVRYLRFEDVSETLNLFAENGLGGVEIKNSVAWDEWVRARDAEVRARVDRGVEDSISNLILYGASYTNLPRLEGVESAASETGELTASARARVHALVAGLPNGARNERLRFVNEFLARKGIPQESVEAKLQENLRQLIAEQRAYQQKLKTSEEASDPAAKLLARGTLFQDRGLSADTSLLPNYALEDTLKTILKKGAIQPGTIHRVLVIRPGLDFNDKLDGYDFYPVQTI